MTYKNLELPQEKALILNLRKSQKAIFGITLEDFLMAMAVCTFFVPVILAN